MNTVFSMVVACGCAAALPAFAEGPWLSADAFRARVEGQLVRTTFDGTRTVFGHEQYITGDRVVWQYPDGRCLLGTWQAFGETICYRYDGFAKWSCLRYAMEGSQLIGHQWDPLLLDQGNSGERLHLKPLGSGTLSCKGEPSS